MLSYEMYENVIGCFSVFYYETKCIQKYLLKILYNLLKKFIKYVLVLKVMN